MAVCQGQILLFSPCDPEGQRSKKQNLYSYPFVLREKKSQVILIVLQKTHRTRFLFNARKDAGPWSLSPSFAVTLTSDK